MFENSAVQPGSADRLGIGWRVRGAYWLARQPFVSLHQQAFNECWWLKVNVLGQTATTATKTARYMRRRDADPFCGTNQPLFLCGRLCMLNKNCGLFFFSIPNHSACYSEESDKEDSDYKRHERCLHATLKTARLILQSFRPPFSSSIKYLPRANSWY